MADTQARARSLPISVASGLGVVSHENGRVEGGGSNAAALPQLVCMGRDSDPQHSAGAGWRQGAVP
jgi:hypothetical protein